MIKTRHIIIAIASAVAAYYLTAIWCSDCPTCKGCATFVIFKDKLEGQTERISDYEIEGIDISKYQRYIGWDLVAAQGFDFAIVKASEGANLTDTHFGQNWSSIKQVGMRRGAYHFFRPNISALAQAKNYLDKVPLEPGDLPPVLDVEEDDGASREMIISRMQAWLDIVEARYKVKPIIYTNLKFYYNYVAGNFDQYPLWIAKYNSVPPQLVNDKQLKIWQYGHKGRVDGIEGHVDLNVFIGSGEDFRRFCIQPQVFYSQMTSASK